MKTRRIKSKATNALSDGRAFQELLKRTFDSYAAQGVAYIHKTDPPVRVIGFGPARKIIFQKNPFLDFIGTWTARGGRTIVLEAKAISGTRLRLLLGKGKDGKPKKGDGITEAQLRNALDWSARGALVAFLWHQDGQTRLVTPEMANAYAVASGEKSIPWLEAHKVPQGNGFALVDVLQAMAALP